MKTQAIQETKEGVVLKLLVKPNSKKTEFLVNATGDEIVIRVRSPPDKGKANKEVLKVVQSFFKGITSRVELISGFTSRSKQIMLYDASVGDVINRLQVTRRNEEKLR